MYIEAPFTKVGHSKAYTLEYRIISYTILILCLPLIILSFITIRILLELRERARIRRNFQTSQQENSNMEIGSEFELSGIFATPMHRRDIELIWIHMLPHLT